MKPKIIFFHKKITFSILILTIFLLLGMKIYETGELKSDGSGSIKIIYSGNASFLIKNNYIIGNFPFNEEMAKKYFTSDNTEVKKAKLDFDVKDSIYYITIEVDFNDINKLSNTKGFSNIKSSYIKTDTGMVFNYILVANPEFYKDFIEQSYTIKFEDKVKSMNGELKDNIVYWSKKQLKESDYNKDIILTATTEAGEHNVAGKSDDAEVNKGKKTCGIFGIELPLIFLFGMFLSFRNKCRKNK